MISTESDCILMVDSAGIKSNRPQWNGPQVKSAPDQIIVLLCCLFNLIIVLFEVVYLIPNQIFVILCCLFNLICIVNCVDW